MVAFHRKGIPTVRRSTGQLDSARAGTHQLISAGMFLPVLPSRDVSVQANRRNPMPDLDSPIRPKKRLATTVFASKSRVFHLLSLTGFACPLSLAKPYSCRISAGFVAWFVVVPGNSAEHKVQPRFRPSAEEAGPRSRHRTATGRIQCSGHCSPGLTLSHLTVRPLTLASRRGDSMSDGRLRDPEGILDRRCPQPPTAALGRAAMALDRTGLTRVPDRSAEIAVPR